jgi:hypothetical protein
MATAMSSLLEEISREHFPYPPDTPEEIKEFERPVGWKLDPDLRAFYLHCNGAELIERLSDSPYQILPSRSLSGRGWPSTVLVVHPSQAERQVDWGAGQVDL